ncbi:MAG: hypothetical protein IJT24_05865 [Lachnospiraceae bacterium]|nr:hypothetical protein [Lachnospiraceae bacterium]
MARKRNHAGSDDELMKMLKHYQADGVSIFFQDHLSSPREVVTMMMMHEDEIFMPDYVMDKQDRLVQIRFDQVL